MANQIVHSNLDPNILIKIAKEHGTPCYVYNKNKIEDNYNSYKKSFEENKIYKNNYLICYAVKANSNIAVLNLLSKNNSGFDIVSIGELNRVIKSGGNPNKIVFSGVGKQDFEIKAALNAKILCFNIESEPELMLINEIAKQLDKKAPVSIRINPNIDAKSHPYISTGLKEHKFGIDINNAENIYNLANELSNINITGIDCHIGSQLTELEPMKQACLAINNLLLKLQDNNIIINHLNMGGGLGIEYNLNDNIPTHKQWVDTILNNINKNNQLKNIPKIIIEPGRSIVGDAGVLLTKVIYNKSDLINNHNFTIVDAAMNDLLRPSLYKAEHRIINLSNNNNNINTEDVLTSIVGPVCESSDVFLKNTSLQSKSNDILVIQDAGAYGFTMSSNYNSRPRAAELLVTENNKVTIIKKRETIEELYANETTIY